MTKQIQVITTFDVGENLDEELFLESFEAACLDMLYDKDKYWMKINWMDSVLYTGMRITEEEEMKDESPAVL